MSRHETIVETTIATKTGGVRMPASSATLATTMPVTPLGVNAIPTEMRSSLERSEPIVPSHAPANFATIETTMTNPTMNPSKFVTKSRPSPILAK
jgi:hypothetical protein